MCADINTIGIDFLPNRNVVCALQTAHHDVRSLALGVRVQLTVRRAIRLGCTQQYEQRMLQFRVGWFHLVKRQPMEKKRAV